MATFTPIVNLEKPLGSEHYLIPKFNANMDKIDNAIGNIKNTALMTTHTQTEAIKSLPTGSLDGKVSNFKADGLSLVNSVSGSNVANGASVSFISVLNNIYYSSFTNTKITGTGSTITITNNSGATVNIIVVNMTALGIESYTESQMLDLVRGGYFDGLKGVENPTFESVGKNLFDKNDITIGKYVNSGGSSVVGSSAVNHSNYIKIKQNANYVRNNTGAVAFYDINYQFISYVNTNTFTTPTNAVYLRFNCDTSLLGSTQLEQGTAATAYEPYKSSALSIQETLRSLPNGIKDRVFEQDGQIWLEKNVAEYTLKSADILNLTTTKTNFDYVQFLKQSNYIGSADKNIIYPNFIQSITITEFTNDDILFVGKISSSISGSYFTLGLAKGTYASLAAAQTALAGTKIHYQLATPQLINLTALGKADGELSSFANGTSILDADTFHSPSVQFSVPSNTGAQISALLESANAQAKQLEAKANKVQEDWIEPTLQNAWVNFSTTDESIAYMKDDMGLVHLKGFIKSGITTGGTRLFDLISGYRPPKNCTFVTVSNNGTTDIIGRISVNVSGAVSISTGANTYLSLNGITFKAV